MIDLHAHILWGVDDGAADAAETLALLRESAQQGVTCIAATAHAYPGVRPFDLEAYTARLEEAKALCKAHLPQLTLRMGAEIAATYQLAPALRNKSVPTLGGSDYALIELWHSIGWQKAYEIADSVVRAGYVPVFSHVERYACFVWEPRRALRFRQETGALLQLNASTLLCRPGLLTRGFLRRMLAEEGIDVVASDMHSLRWRAPNLGPAYALLTQTVGAAYAKRLTHFEVMEA